MSEPDTITLTFTAAPGWERVPFSCRIRKLLKMAGRSYGLRCTNYAAADAEPVRPDVAEPPPGNSR